MLPPIGTAHPKRWFGAPLLMFALALWHLAPAVSPTRAEPLSVGTIADAVVQIKTFIDPDGRTVGNLGRDREGSGVVIADDGLVLTIGYLMVEAHAAEIVTNAGRRVAAEIVGYDYDTGFGLLKASSPLGVKPMPFGRSADLASGERVLVAAFGGVDQLGAASVASKREFAGYWEYLLDEAIFTTPPHPRWSGAALVNRDGRLVGIGSLVVGDASGLGTRLPGNMFVPTDLLSPILGELIAEGRVSGRPKPWIGLTTDAIGSRLAVRRTTPGGPAEKAGIEAGDVIVRIGAVAPTSLADFYRRLWASGSAGTKITLDINRKGEQRTIDIESTDRRRHLRLRSTF